MQAGRFFASLRMTWIVRIACPPHRLSSCQLARAASHPNSARFRTSPPLPHEMALAWSRRWKEASAGPGGVTEAFDPEADAVFWATMRDWTLGLVDGQRPDVDPHRLDVIDVVSDRRLIVAGPTIDIVSDMKSFFDRSIEHARRAGIPDRHIILDPGIGFGKSWEQHLEALRRLPEIRALGFPILVGVSRKSVLGRIHNTTTAPKDRLYGSIASHVMAIAYGADIVRVHDVRPHVEACQVADAIRGRNI